MFWFLFWIILGIIGIIVEVFTVTFASLWFGFSAFAVAGLVFFMPEVAESIKLQFALWGSLSFVTMFIWFKIYQPMASIEKKLKGMKSGELINEKGILVKMPTSQKAGVIRFHVPICGDNEWQCRIENEDMDNVNIGDHMKVIAIEKNYLVVAINKK